MGLRELAEADLKFTLEDKVFGFGFDVTLTDPTGLSSTDLTGQTNDIGMMIDVETGEVISSRHATVALRISTLMLQGFTSLPKDVPNSSLKPWLVTFNDIQGKAYTFKVIRSFPDNGLGLVKCVLGIYKPTI